MQLLQNLFESCAVGLWGYVLIFPTCLCRNVVRDFSLFSGQPPHTRRAMIAQPKGDGGSFQKFADEVVRLGSRHSAPVAVEKDDDRQRFGLGGASCIDYEL